MDRAVLRFRLPGFATEVALDATLLRRGALLAFAAGVAAGLVHARALGFF